MVVTTSPSTILVGMRGFEPPASASRTLRSSQAEPHPVEEEVFSAGGREWQAFLWAVVKKSAFTYCTCGQVYRRLRGPEARCAGASPRTNHSGGVLRNALTRAHRPAFVASGLSSRTMPLPALSPRARFSGRHAAVASHATPASLAQGTESYCTSHASSGAGTFVPVEGGTRRPDVL